MERTQQQKLIITLGAVLVAVLVASGVVVYIVSTSSEEEVDPLFVDEASTGSDETDTPAPAGNQTGFNTTPLQRNEYTSLNAQLIQSGQLPVQPPAATGKANPFL